MGVSLLERILIIGPAWLGDMVMSQPLIAALNQQHPGAEIHVLSPSWAAGVVARMPGVTAVIEVPLTHGGLQWGLRRALARKLRDQHFTQAIVLPNSWKSALIPALACIPRRTGYRGEMRYGLLNDLRLLDAKAIPRMVDRFHALSFPAHSKVPASPNPVLTPDPAALSQTLQRLQLNLKQPVLALCPGAEFGPAKRWPARHFATLARTMSERGFQVWLLGSQKDQPQAEEITRLSGLPLHNLCGQTRLPEVIDLLSQATQVVTNDSGLMHVACALNRPVIALYGSSSPSFTPPLSPQAKILSLNLSCSPCFQRQCPLGHLNCLEHLEPQQVADLI
jgi:heptosyltransferase-2